MENEGWRMITICDEQAAKRDLSIYCSFTCRYRLPSLMSWLLSIPTCHYLHFPAVDECNSFLIRSLACLILPQCIFLSFVIQIWLAMSLVQNLSVASRGLKGTLNSLKRAGKQSIHFTTGPLPSLPSLYFYLLPSLLFLPWPSTSLPCTSGRHQASSSILASDQAL